MGFLQKVLERRRWAFRNWEIKSIRVPAHAEFGIERTYGQALSIKDFQKYMPYEWDCARKIEREYYWDILSTLAHEWVYALVADCRRIRDQNKQGQTIPRQQLSINPSYLQEMLTSPFVSSMFLLFIYFKSLFWNYLGRATGGRSIIAVQARG